MLTKNISIRCFLLVAFFSAAQHLPFQNIYNDAEGIYNPAFLATSTQRNHQINSGANLGRGRLGSAISGSYTDNYLNYSGRSKKIGYGVTVYNTFGMGLYDNDHKDFEANVLRVSVSAAYRFKIDEDINISFGVNMGWLRENISSIQNPFFKLAQAIAFKRAEDRNTLQNRYLLRLGGYYEKGAYFMGVVLPSNVFKTKKQKPLNAAGHRPKTDQETMSAFERMSFLSMVQITGGRLFKINDKSNLTARIHWYFHPQIPMAQFLEGSVLFRYASFWQVGTGIGVAANLIYKNAVFVGVDLSFFKTPLLKKTMLVYSFEKYAHAWGKFSVKNHCFGLRYLF